MEDREKKFEIGRLTVTRSVADLMKQDRQFRDFISVSLGRYVNCDWGDLTEGDKAKNDDAVLSGDDRIFGSYVHRLPDGGEIKIWIITEWDRSETTILFPDEY